LSRGEQSCPFGQPGDLLWVRERWAGAPRGRYVYAVDGARKGVRFHAPFTMPRAACRTMLRITKVELQRLQSISAREARGEGYDESRSDLRPREWFAELWDRIFTDPGQRWNDDPPVWVIHFEIITPAARRRPPAHA
jgi:hypothetical protein